MRVLVACESSGIVREAFRKRGFDAWSCDLVPAEDSSEYHITEDALAVINDGWDIIIGHPPCTYLASMGIWWNHKRPERWQHTHAALAFAEKIAAADCPRIAIENPIGYLNKHWNRFPGGPTQIVHPWQFGHEASKPTCLWLKGLPKLIPTMLVGKGAFYVKANGARMAKWSHITSGTRKAERARIASRTFKGIAEAMADQWGRFMTASINTQDMRQLVIS